MTCPICSNGEAQVRNTIRDSKQVICPLCGEFEIQNTAYDDNQGRIERNRWQVSSWLREYQPRLVGETEIEQALAANKPSLMHRADRMLREINRRSPNGSDFLLADLYLPLTSVGWNSNGGEARFMLEEVLCNSLGYIASRGNTAYRITTKGLLHLESYSKVDSAIGFCAMWFNEEVMPLWVHAIAPAIRECGYEPLRIDGVQHNGKIDDEIIAAIRRSKFVVSDYTGQRGGVYYEAGFAHGLGLPVIFMCREDELQSIHFDVRQYNCIKWAADALPKAQSDLKNRILATLGQGPLRVQ